MAAKANAAVDGWKSAQEVAVECKVDPQVILKLVREGKAVGKKRGLGRCSPVYLPVAEAERLRQVYNLEAVT